MTLSCYPTPGMGANTYLLEQEGVCLIVDPGDANSPALARAKEIGNVAWILLTHGHFDHILGAAAFRRETGAPLVIHALDAPMLTDPVRSLHAWMGEGLGAQEPVDADRLVGDGAELPFGDTGIRVLHTPGHSPGSVCYAVGDLLFSGDTLFCGSMGCVDFPGGDAGQMTESLRRLAALEGERTVLPGHGEATTLSRERAENPYVKRACYGTLCDR